MAIGGQLNPMNNLPGKSLTRAANGKWEEGTFPEIASELGRPNIRSPRVLSVESTYDRIKRLQPLGGANNKQKESFEVFASDPQCSSIMRNTFHFPGYIFSASWSKSNGFAGSTRLPDGNISWFRLLIKMINGLEEYYWHEMTFFIHQLDAPDSPVTVICFEVPDDPIDSNDPAKPDGPKPEIEPHNFLKELKTELEDSPNRKIDWRYMQSLLLRQAIIVVDRGVWACSKAVRKLEKSRPRTTPGLNNSFDFPRAHDLLRHALHSTEILQVASQTLTAWMERYNADERRLQRIKHGQQQREILARNPQHKLVDYEEDTPLVAECYHAELLASLQLLSNLAYRSASNDARLRNEINLAFNVVNQQDTKAVRIISIVTLTFLPATFVSTLFSMSFFNYDGASGRWKMSGWIWVYFVIAVPLTALTIAAWIWGARIWRRLSRKRSK